MTVALTGNGGWGVRTGHLAAFLADIVALMGGTATARVLSGASAVTRGTTIETDAAYSPAVSAVIGDHWSSIDSWRSSQSSAFQAFKSLAEKVLISQVDQDTPLPTKDVTTALRELRRQMIAAGTSINASSVSVGSQTSVGTPNGNPVFVLSAKSGDGLVNQCVFPETLTVSVTGDSQNGSTLRQEPFTVKGKAAVSDVFAYNWPGGSGCNVSMNLADAQLDNSGSTKLVNGDFEDFSSNYPRNWVVQTGTAGTDVFAAGSSDAYTQSNALKITSDGTTQVAVHQQFNTAVSTSDGAGGTPATVTPRGQYAVQFRYKVLATTAAGVLRVALVDGSNAVINDDAGVANSFTVDLTAATTSYASATGVFRLPSVLPSTVRLQFKTTTAMVSTRNLIIDDVGFAEMTELYSMGISVAGFAGATKVITGDSFTFAVTNTMGVFASWIERFFSIRDKRLQLPYSGSPTISDALVV